MIIESLFLLVIQPSLLQFHSQKIPQNQLHFPVLIVTHLIINLNSNINININLFHHIQFIINLHQNIQVIIQDY